MLEPFIEKAFEKIKDAKLAPIYEEQLNLLKEHIAFLSEKLMYKEKELGEAEYKLNDLEKEVKQLQSELLQFDGQAKSIDIGPCFVKLDKEGVLLYGMYCNKCKNILIKAGGVYGKNGYWCKTCSSILPREVVDRAFNDFLAKCIDTPPTVPPTSNNK